MTRRIGLANGRKKRPRSMNRSISRGSSPWAFPSNGKWTNSRPRARAAAMHVNFDSIWWPKPSKLCCPIRHTPGVHCVAAATSRILGPTERQARSVGEVFVRITRCKHAVDTRVGRMKRAVKGSNLLPPCWKRAAAYSQNLPRKALDRVFWAERGAERSHFSGNGLLCEPLRRQDQGGDHLDGGRPQRCCDLRH